MVLVDFRAGIVEALQRQSATDELDAVLLYRPENAAYVSGYFPGAFMSGPVMVVLPTDGAPIVVTNFFEEAFVRAMSWIDEVRVYTSYRLDVNANPARLASEEAAAILRSLGLATASIGIDDARSARLLSEALPGLTTTDVASHLAQRRLIKAPGEVTLIRQAAHLADVGHEAFLDGCVEGASEIAIRANAQCAMEAEGFVLHPLGVKAARMGVVGPGLGSGRWPYWFTNTPTARRLKRGEMLLADGGVVLYSGHNSDIARTAIVGRPSTDQRKIYEAALDAEVTAIKAVRPGIRSHELDQVMRDVLAKHGYSDHATRVWGGHDIGFGPRGFDIAPFDDTVLRTGMVICLEPGVYVPSIGGVRIEDMVLVTRTGPEVLTTCRKALGQIAT
jgi:Xaa-Pro dipeptidase